MNWLFKEEPTHYSYDDLVRDKKTVWSGVRNPVAQKNLRSVRKGDRIFYYHTGDEKSGRSRRQALCGRRRARREARPSRDAQGDQGRRRVQGLSPRSDLAAVRDAGHGCGVGAYREDVEDVREGLTRRTTRSFVPAGGSTPGRRLNAVEPFA